MPAKGVPSRVDGRDFGRLEAVVTYPLGQTLQVRLAARGA